MQKITAHHRWLRWRLTAVMVSVAVGVLAVKLARRDWARAMESCVKARK